MAATKALKRQKGAPPAATRAPKAGPRRRAAKPAKASSDVDTRSTILAAALDLFAERNFSSVTIKDIAARVGLNTALIYYYFGSKEDLFRRCVTMAVDQAFAQFEARRSAMTTPERVILEWLETHIRAYSSIRKLIKISMDYVTASNRTAEIDQAIRRFYDVEHALLLASLRDGQGSGIFRAVEVVQTALFISTYLDGVIVRSIILPDFDPEAAIRDMQTFMHDFLSPGRPADLSQPDAGQAEARPVRASRRSSGKA